LSEATSLAIEQYAFQHLETGADVEQDMLLLREVFGKEDEVDVFVRNLITGHPRMTLNDHFVIKHRGRIVASLNLIPQEWNIGGVPLKVAEMGCVATQPAYRHQGLIRRLVEEYHRQVADQGYDLSVIEGIPYFYRQFGYEYSLPLGHELKIRLDQLPDLEATSTTRPFTDNDITEAMRLLSESQRQFYVHLLRSRDIWELQKKTGFAGGSRFEAYVVEEQSRVVAYFRVGERRKERELLLREVSDTEQTTAKTILRQLKDLGRQRGLDVLNAQVSYESSLAQYLTGVGATRRMPLYAWQIRITDHAKILLKMKTLLESRLATSMYRRLTEQLNLNLYRYTVQLTVENGLITHVQRLESNDDRTIRLNPLAFPQLLLGYRSREELETIYPDFRVQNSHKHLVDILFPKFQSYIDAAY
jgi:predicted acetyltransferase